MAVSGSAFAFVIDVIAVTCRRPVLAGAPMLAVYLIPATRMPGGLNWLAFICAAAGYLALIGTDGHERLGQWGRAVHHNVRPSLDRRRDQHRADPPDRDLVDRRRADHPAADPGHPAAARLRRRHGRRRRAAARSTSTSPSNIAKDLSTSTAVNLFEYTHRRRRTRIASTSSRKC